MNDTFCFIPARGGSKRFPRKNIAPLLGKPLIAHVIDVLAEAIPAGKIVVSTDDDTVERAVRHHQETCNLPGLHVDRRPQELGSDKATVAQVLQEYLVRARPVQRHCFCVYPTAVLLPVRIVRDGIQRFEANVACQALMGASEYNLHPWQALYQNSELSYVPYFPDLYDKKAQEFPRFHCSNGSFYLVRCKEFSEHPDFYSTPLDLFLMSSEESVDINYPEDLKIAERILQWRKQKQASAVPPSNREMS